MSFESDVLKSGKPALVDYWAEWCGPAKMIAPIPTRSETNGGPGDVVKMNVDDKPSPRMKFIRGIPTLMSCSRTGSWKCRRDVRKAQRHGLPRRQP